MKISSVRAVWFSPTGNAEKAARCIGEELASALDVPLDVFDFTLPRSRVNTLTFRSGELAVVAVPVYAGRVPNKLLPYLQSRLEGGGAPAIPVAVYGNRNFDSALVELRDLLRERGLHPVAAAGVPTEHVFSPRIATGRPNEEDLAALRGFARLAAEKVAAMTTLPAKAVAVRGEEPAVYYTPLTVDRKPASFLKAKPKTDPDKCTNCGVCAAVCPMGAISFDDPALVPGICIKCQACVKKCPAGAKYFDDPLFLSHVAMLEENYRRRAEAEFFL